MTAQEFAAQFRGVIQDTVEKGMAQIRCEDLIAYLDDVINLSAAESSESSLEKYKAELQLHIDKSKNHHLTQLEMFRSTIISGQNAVRSSFLLNGGASVALLAFIGRLTEINPDKVGVFSGALMQFVVGVLLITMVSGFTYLSQWLYGNEGSRCQSWGFRVNILNIALGVSSYLFFICGMWTIHQAFLNFV